MAVAAILESGRRGTTPWQLATIGAIALVRTTLCNELCVTWPGYKATYPRSQALEWGGGGGGKESLVHTV